MAATITEVLQAWNAGDAGALERLMPLVYSELRGLARHQLLRENKASLQPTELVHEVYVRLTGDREPQWRDRLHFYGAASHVMRRVLVDESRRRGAVKRGATRVQVPMADDLATWERSLEFDALDEALRKLAAFDPQQARVVELRFFGGLLVEETAEVLAISTASVKRDWAVAKAWLRREFQTTGETPK